VSTVAYTGEVTPGGPSDVRELGPLTLRKMAVSDMHNNVYLLTCTATGEQLMVDAADDPARCLALVAEGTGRLDHLVTTHQHWDHVRALEEVARATGATTYAGADDADALPLAPDVRLRQGDTVSVGELVLDVVHLRGHTPGSVALAWHAPDGGTHLLTGDSLFPGGVGNTKRPEQSFPDLYRDVTERIFAVYDDATVFYPGHGDDGRLADERPHLDEWRERGW
jgi:glyoxylase-like metal-dependent hydrolase (beta-lactamase superfamily II)